jgi:hypothetical protein
MDLFALHVNWRKLICYMILSKSNVHYHKGPLCLDCECQSVVPDYPIPRRIPPLWFRGKLKRGDSA